VVKERSPDRFLTLRGVRLDTLVVLGAPSGFPLLAGMWEGVEGCVRHCLAGAGLSCRPLEMRDESRFSFISYSFSLARFRLRCFLGVVGAAVAAELVAERLDVLGEKGALIKDVVIRNLQQPEVAVNYSCLFIIGISVSPHVFSRNATYKKTKSEKTNKHTIQLIYPKKRFEHTLF